MVEVRLEFCGCVRTGEVLKASGELLQPVDERAKQGFTVRLEPADHPPCRYNVYVGRKLVLSSQKLGRRPTVEEIKAKLQKQTKRNRRGVARR